MNKKVEFHISLNASDDRIEELKTYLKANNIPFQTNIDKSSEFDFKKLGKRGQLVLDLLSKGMSYTEIAQESGLTIDGVRYYVKKIYKTLGVNKGILAVQQYMEQQKNQ